MNNGYVMLLLPDHPRADAKGYVQEHVLIVERALGKHLNAKHQVHHADLRRANNANENLVACEDAAYHLLLHRRLRALLACGDANARLCHLCKGYDRQSDISISRSDRRGYERCYHRSCAAEREERRRVARSQIQEIAS